jgi:hypothetical protein
MLTNAAILTNQYGQSKNNGTTCESLGVDVRNMLVGLPLHMGTVPLTTVTGQTQSDTCAAARRLMHGSRIHGINNNQIGFYWRGYTDDRRCMSAQDGCAPLITAANRYVAKRYPMRTLRKAHPRE